MATLYAQVIIPRPLDASFTYSVPQELESSVAIGSRVIVPFGPKRFLTGIVEALSPVKPADVADIKPLESVLEQTPVVIHPQLKLWHWIAGYYMCAVGDVMKAALPSGLKMESETVIETAPDVDPESVASLPPDDFDVFEIVRRRGKLSLKDLSKAVSVSRLEHRVARLVEGGILAVHESMVNRYRRVKVRMVTPVIKRGDTAALQQAFDAVRRSQGQQAALLNLIALSGHNKMTEAVKAVAVDRLLEASPDITRENIMALQRKGLAQISVREVSRFTAVDDSGDNRLKPLPVLSSAQKEALAGIHRSMTDHSVTLLHGVTSSGKTEVYMHLADYVMSQGRQVLLLVPEIALTTQLTRRMQAVFGSKVIIYHSKFSDNERVDIWRDMLAASGPRLVIGARSSVFLPFKSLGLVIVDEEHDPGYKQADPAPRYNGRDVAIMLASYHGAKTLLGSATPSVESYYKATEGGKYGLVSLTERYGEAVLPAIEVVDMKRERLRQAVDGMLSHTTIAATRALVADGRQAIYFHNRRGFSPRARCRMCQFTPKCDFCDVALTYHKRTNTLECHYCGATYPVPKVCPACHEPAVEIEGYGTERIEDGVASVFPEARVLRMDLDSTRNKDAYATIIDDFSQRKADILVGTQMVTKGLDFKDVGLVAILNADALVNFPDFRANERAFNLMEQVAGRAGRRKDNPGSVIVQSYSPDSPIIGYVCRHDYEGFYRWELEQRRRYMYPPFSRVVNIYLRHRERAVVDRVAMEYAARLRQLLGNRVHGPVEPDVERVSSLYIRKIMLKIETAASIFKVKDVLRAVYVEFNSGPVKTGVLIHYDVDPS